MKKVSERTGEMIAVVIFLLATVLFLWDFSKSVNSVTYKKTAARVDEVTKQLSVTFGTKMEDSLEYIKSLSDFLCLQEIEPEKLPELLDHLAEDTLFCHIDFVDKNYTSAKTGQNYSVLASKMGGGYFSLPEDKRLGVSKTITETQQFGDVLVIYAPVYKGEELEGLVYGFLRTKDLERQINIESFEGKGNTFVFQPDGHIIVSSHALGCENFFDSLGGSELLEEQDKTTVQENIAAGKEGFVEVFINGQEGYAAYRQVGVRDWYIATTVPKSYIEEYSTEVQRSVKQLSFKYIALFLILLTYVANRISKSKKQIEDAYEELKISHRMFEVAIEKSDDAIFRYDIRTKVALYAKKPEYMKETQGLRLENIPFDCEKYFYIHPAYVSKYISLYEKIISGAPNGEEDIFLVMPDGSNRWNRITLTTIYDSAHNPVNAIGFARDVTNEKVVREKLATETKYRQAILNNTIFVYEFNTTKTLITNLHPEEERDPNFYGLERYIYRPAYGGMQNLDTLHPDDVDVVKEFFDINNVKLAFMRKLQSISVEYRIKDKYDNWVWVENPLHFLHDDSDEIKGIAYVKNINDIKLNQLKMKTKVETDDLTGVLNRTTAAEKITEILKQDPQTVHAFVIADIDNFKGINDHYGHQRGDEILKAVAASFKAELRESDIVARLGGDELIMLVKNVKNITLTKMKALSIGQRVKNICVNEADGRYASLSMGIAMAPGDGLSFDQLYENADKALYKAKEKGKARIEFYKED